MAEDVTIARPYAEAVFELARESDTLDQWSDMLAFLERVVTEPEIEALIGDPNFGTVKLESLLLGVAGEKINGGGRNLLQVLTRNNRLLLLPAMRALFEERKAEAQGVVEATICSAFPMSEEQVQALVKRLETKYQRQVKVELSVEPELIGGVKITAGDEVFDATVRGKLDNMRAALTR